MTDGSYLKKGVLPFSVEARLLRELGERLVKEPEVALVELIKNSYDADATDCLVAIKKPDLIKVVDDGQGMTFDQFIAGWMTIGTASKMGQPTSRRYGRKITGEKGIGRFAVRFLGSKLVLESVALDSTRDNRATKLTATFDWPEIDKQEDVGKIEVPFTLRYSDVAETGTTLKITRLRERALAIDLQRIRTSSAFVVSPLRSLLNESPASDEDLGEGADDPGFSLRIDADEEPESGDVASEILKAFTLRAVMTLKDNNLELSVFRAIDSEPFLRVTDKHRGVLDFLWADIRFFPRRKGAFVGLPVDGRIAYSWVNDNSGVAVFDRGFRVAPYGLESDDWLFLARDVARNRRDPRSPLANRHFPIPESEKSDTSQNWMLRLPQSAQLVGLVQVEGRREGQGKPSEEGLVASADREGFVDNQAFNELRDLVRGAVEAIAYVDRKVQQQRAKEEEQALIESIRQGTREAIRDVKADPSIEPSTKSRIVQALVETQDLAERRDELAKEREQQLLVMSLLGVVAGFMTHEFGVAIQELREAKKELDRLADDNPMFGKLSTGIADRIGRLKDFLNYSTAYIQGAKEGPAKAYPVLPRLKQVLRIFGDYAVERGIKLELEVSPGLKAPKVPVALYNGLALNLFSNALKAVTSKVDCEEPRIELRAWNDSQWHYLESVDTGIGIPPSLKERVFDPLFSTTSANQDPLGSGMGLGLTIVRRTSEAFGGSAEVVEAPPGFTTCVRVRLPR